VKPRKYHKHYPTKLPHAFDYQGRISNGKHDTGTEANSPAVVGQRPQSGAFQFFFHFKFFCEIKKNGTTDD
jgi:hypothetical protein